LKKTKTWLIIVAVIAVAALAWGSIITVRWQNSEYQLARAEEQLAQAQIEGFAYVDWGAIGAYDGPDWEAEGLKIQLWEAGKNILLQETTVNSDGKYTFTVEPGRMYYVVAVQGILGYPSWGWITTLRYSGNILVQQGESYDGPIFLVRENWEGKG